MTADEFDRLAKVIQQPLVLVSASGEILAANASAADLCDAFTAGRQFADVLGDGVAAARLLQAWSQHGDPVPTRFTVLRGAAPVTVRAHVTRVELAGGPAILIHARADQHAPFAQLNDRLQLLQREVRYRVAAERERAAALAAERAARAQLERVQRLSAALAAALDVDDVVDAIMTHAAEAVGVDRLVVALLGNQALEVSSGADAAVGVAGGSLPLASSHPLAVAARERTPQLFRSPAELAGEEGAPAGGSGYLAAALPLVTSPDKPAMGALGLVACRARTLSDDERASAELVALLCAQALERARLYDRERRFAETLQWALLPKTLPDLPGFDLAFAYLPASERAAVGGDWYDAFALGEDRVGLVVGDVAGHGPAAATAMAQMRNALRAFAAGFDDAGAALAAFNDYLCAQLPDDMATLVYLVVDRSAGTVTYANAGHLPPLLQRAGGYDYLRAGLSPPVGVTPGETFSTETLRLDGPVRLVCYSDGLIERRGEHIDAGLRRLEGALLPDESSAKALCAHLVTRLVGEDNLSDDAVVLVAGTTPAGRGQPAGRARQRAAATRSVQPTPSTTRVTVSGPGYRTDLGGSERARELPMGIRRKLAVRSVSAEDGATALRGQVDRPEQVTRLEEAVARVTGVRQVDNYRHPPGVTPENVGEAMPEGPNGG